MMKKFSLMMLVAVVFSSAVISGAGAQGIPQPFRIGGLVTIDGIQITQATDNGLVITVTRINGSNYTDFNNNPSQDNDGLNASNFYLIDIPIYSADHQPGGANPGETARLHVFRNGTELNVTVPANGGITVGASGDIFQINIVSAAAAQQFAVSVPTMTEWGMVLFMIAAGLTSLYCLKPR
jgi:hypothetical protein